MVENSRVAIIGAGPSGLAALDALCTLKAAGEAVPEFVCYERQALPGGIWNFSYRTGFDEFGEPIHSSMYKHLWSNGPKECLEMANYTFQEHFGKPIPSYPPREVLADYLFGRMKKNGCEQYIQYKHAVRSCVFDDATQKFTLVIENIVDNSTQTQIFDYVICASGHFSIPNTPHFEGMEYFSGRIAHAHDFRDAAEFAGQDVLIIGTSYSAEDIASQCWKYGAKSITISHRTRPCGFHWPECFSEVPLLQRLEGKTAHFKDGTSKDVDAILMCTGYLHRFPFLPENLKLKCANTLWIDGLYNSCVFHKNPKLFFCGMQDQYYTYNLFDLQGYYAVDVITGHITLPSEAEMAASDAEFSARGKTLNGYEDDINFQGDYMKNMQNACRYPKFDIDAIAQTFFDWEHTKHGDIMGYRDHGHKSVITGHMAPVHNKKWIEEFDDSLGCFTNN